MERVLADFYGFSGRRVNRGKSSLWFSPNSPCFMRHVICSEFGILPMSDLGPYLGVPILHGRPLILQYQYILDNATRRLFGWKGKLLSKTSRAILLKSTLAALPYYTMQSILLPKGIIGRLEQLCRQFFWGHDHECRKLHTLSCDVLCRPKAAGGLGFPRLHMHNQILLCKLIWRLLRSPHQLSSQILVGKYGGWPALMAGKSRASPHLFGPACVRSCISSSQVCAG